MYVCVYRLMVPLWYPGFRLMEPLSPKPKTQQARGLGPEDGGNSGGR